MDVALTTNYAELAPVQNGGTNRFRIQLLLRSPRYRNASEEERHQISEGIINNVLDEWRGRFVAKDSTRPASTKEIDYNLMLSLSVGLLLLPPPQHFTTKKSIKQKAHSKNKRDQAQKGPRQQAVRLDTLTAGGVHFDLCSLQSAAIQSLCDQSKSKRRKPAVR